MNNKGWEMADMLWILAAFGIALIVVAILYIQNFGDLSNSSKKASTSSDVQVTSPTMAKEEEKEPEETSEKTNLSYQEIEELLRSAAIDYVKQFYNDQSVSEVIIKASDLEKEAMLSGIYDYNDPTSSCEGYVRYKQEGNTYEPYLRCGNNYITAGFNDNLVK